MHTADNIWTAFCVTDCPAGTHPKVITKGNHTRYYPLFRSSNMLLLCDLGQFNWHRKAPFFGILKDTTVTEEPKRFRLTRAIGHLPSTDQSGISQLSLWIRPRRAASSRPPSTTPSAKATASSASGRWREKSVERSHAISRRKHIISPDVGPLGVQAGHFARMSSGSVAFTINRMLDMTKL
jgi:hypothetical protein